MSRRKTPGLPDAEARGSADSTLYRMQKKRFVFLSLPQLTIAPQKPSEQRFRPQSDILAVRASDPCAWFWRGGGGGGDEAVVGLAVKVMVALAMVKMVKDAGWS